MTARLNPKRLLICDDEADITRAYQRIFVDLISAEGGGNRLDALSAELFGDGDLAATEKSDAIISDIVYCRQGEDAVAAFVGAQQQDNPFAAVFLDVRMPPGIDGVEAAKRIRAIDPAVNIVIVTGHSDHRPAEISKEVGAPDRLFYLVKPFNPDEVRQLATTLANRWVTDMLAADQLAARLSELERANVALRASEAGAHQAARRDPLTDLLNRKGLDEIFLTCRAEATKAGRGIALLYLDLDRFKLVNDTHGHGVGDDFIREVSRRIVDAVNGNGWVARLGGDEFAILCPNDQNLQQILNHLIEVGTQPFFTGGHQIPISLSTGYAKFEPSTIGLQEAMRQADIALYSAKAAGRGVAREFNEVMDQDFLESQQLAEELGQAIRQDELMLHYQPLMSADGKQVTGVEALLRWDHPRLGSVSPQVFVSLAEQSNLIIDLGDWVLQQAFRDACLWPDVVTSINLSPAQLARHGFAERVFCLAGELEVCIPMIEFEITETALSHDMITFADQVQTLAQAGFRFALDDFGSGYAGIGYLSKLHFNKLKIDRSFIGDLNIKPNAERMVRSMVGLAEAMGLTVTAEGVEEDFQHALLMSAGCNQMQGYLFHKPGPKEMVEKVLLEQRQSGRAA
jgi:diguanylate cyclase (GGDEF)-like protein